MTFSILAIDSKSGAIGGAAATGSLCVGGWVLRGNLQSGMSASQGASPSTFWGEDVLMQMKLGHAVESAMSNVTNGDSGRRFRQLSVLSLSGETAVFSGESNSPIIASRAFKGGIAAGNMLDSSTVIDSMVDAYLASSASFPERLISSLQSGESAGGDFRGLLSAALLILHPDKAPLSLRIDYSKTPLDDLNQLFKYATTGDYARWSAQVPTLNNKECGLD